jgi:predicted aldo/keto reductase-like oxidoreductase
VLTKFTELERLKIDDLQLKATNIVLQSNSFAAYYKDQQDKLSKEHDNDLSELNKDANDYLKAHNLEKKYLYNVKTGQFEFVPKPTPSATKSAVTPVSLAPKK